MEVFITNLNQKTTREQLQDDLKTILQRFQIETYDVRRRTGNAFAQLTIADILKAQSFLSTAIQNPSLTALPPPNSRAKISQSRKSPDAHLLRVLQKEEKDRLTRKSPGRIAKKSASQDASKKSNTPILFSILECGRWILAGDSTQFVPFHTCNGDGHLARNGRSIVLKMNEMEIHIDMYNVKSCALSRVLSLRTLTIDLMVAPRIYSIGADHEENVYLDHIFQSSRANNFRICALLDASPKTTGHCLTYRLSLLPSNFDGGFLSSFQRLTSNQISVIRINQNLTERIPSKSFDQEVELLNKAVRNTGWSFPVRFQVQALWANAALSPAEVRMLIPNLISFQKACGEGRLAMVLQRLVAQLPYATIDRAFRAHSVKTALAVVEQQEVFNTQEKIQSLRRKSKRDEISVHRVLVTPTGIYLYGPEEVAANRVLRQHRDKSDCFLRVSFAEETENRISFDKDFSNDKVLYGRFLTILRDGLDIAGEQFDFLGFSHSSLRSQTCWFMRPIWQPNSLLHARALITSLGDFSSIRCPAKCAARIGQAFSETYSAISFEPHMVTRMDDLKVGRYLFTDGCGVMSTAAWKRLTGATSTKIQPTLYQIRYKGAKGMVSLNTALSGTQIRLRDSMIKFTGSPSDDIEICGTNARAIPFKLNRQIIKILEDLRVPGSVFEDLQEQAIQKLHSSATSTISAIEFLSKHMSDSASGLPTLLKALKAIKIDVIEDSFLRDLLGALLQVQLRDIKYKSRIFVPDAKTLYGICDETGFLREGQIYVTYHTEAGEKEYLDGRVAVTRSPALHPGDIQLAYAIRPPDGSMLWNLTNCVVFSQKGSRDMPSMLSGGDLDGDLYNIIYDDRLIPPLAFPPAAYLPAEAVDIGRSVTSNDMTRFFIDFMQNDQLGRIATLHQVFADQLKEGTFSETCLLLAELHSNAVDFSKSGVPVDIKKIPRAPPYRPDFMAPSASTKVEKGISRSEIGEEIEGQQRYRYYESDCILGHLYRAIDEDAFFQDLEDDASSLFNREAEDNVLAEIWHYVETETSDQQWHMYRDIAIQVRDYYESTLSDIMIQYAVGRTESLTEKEVFIGKILGRSGSGTKIQREQSDMLKTRFNRELKDIKSWMEDQMEYAEDGMLDLAAACLYIAVHEPRIDTIYGQAAVELKSFGWFAAGLCVPELVQREDRNGPSHLFGALSI